LIWLCGGESRRDRALFARLMAEYARQRRCVRRAARGFSPAVRFVMLRQKAGADRVWSNGWKRTLGFFRREQERRRKTMPQKTDGRNAMCRRNESFFEKNGKKQGISCAKFFAIAFMRRLMYCIMVVCARRDSLQTLDEK
jgi:hypothetical protein